MTMKMTMTAEAYWEDETMALTLSQFKKGNFTSLIDSEPWMYTKVPQVVISGRAGKGLSIGYDKTELPVMVVKHRYTILYLKQ